MRFVYALGRVIYRVVIVSLLCTIAVNLTDISTAFHVVLAIGMHVGTGG